ncbi:MAG: glycoside hydrolase family 1 protein [Oligoflexia bacterium]|nr:glycoside hydrolase family 1 protein [Oligoflexia bacterium]
MAEPKPNPAHPFLWGTATSSHQVEGGNEYNDWWAWEHQDRIEGGARSGKATDHWRLFREDLQLAADLGLTSYRFSVEWSRIEPREGEWNDEALDWYANLIAECERLGLVPMLTLHHFTSPQWFAAQGGFANKQSPEKFFRYCERVVARLGSRVPLWCIFNEPMVLVAGTYLASFMPPAEYSPRNAARASANLLRAHVLVYDLIHAKVEKREGPWADIPLMVGIAHNMLDFKPDRKWHPIERVLTSIFRRFYNRAWLDAVTGKKQRFGVWGVVPYPEQVSEARGRVTVDFIGVNYYTKAYVQWRPKAPATERPAQLPLGVTFARRKEDASDLGWAVYPKGFGRILKFAASYGLPLYITENGIADRDDRLRGEYIDSHLKEVAKAVQAGIDIRGYYYWSLLDNFEWIKGFGPRFGLYRVNYETFERTPQPSTQIYKKWISNQKNLGF